MSILRQRLQQALNDGRKVNLCTGSCGWIGLPTYLDDEYVELSAVIASTSGEGVECSVTNWIVRIDKIHAMSIFTEVWDVRRLNELPCSDNHL